MEEQKRKEKKGNQTNPTPASAHPPVVQAFVSIALPDSIKDGSADLFHDVLHKSIRKFLFLLACIVYFTPHGRVLHQVTALLCRSLHHPFYISL